MIIIVDSKIFFYKALQRDLPITDMFPAIIKEIQMVKNNLQTKETIKAVLFVGDWGKSAYRLSIYPQYKGHRSYPSANEEVQEYYIGAIPNVAEALDMIPIFIKDVEADDIAGLLTADIAHNTDETIVLLTADHDWRQLVLKFDNVFLKTQSYAGLQDKKYIQKQELVDDFFEFLLKKAMIGDISDNIKGLHRCGATIFWEFLRQLRNTPEYSTDNLKTKFEIVIDLLPKLPKQVTAHRYYKDDNNEVMSIKNALKVNMQLGEIITTTDKLTPEANQMYTSYRRTVERRVMKNRPLYPNITKANEIIEAVMVTETNEFGGPANIPEGYGAMLHLLSKGGV